MCAMSCSDTCTYASMYPMSRVEAASVAKMAFKNVPSQKLVVGGASGSHMPTMEEEMYLTTATFKVCPGYVSSLEGDSGKQHIPSQKILLKMIFLLKKVGYLS